ncbi:ATPase, partial [Rhizobium johnstonii]
MSETAEKGLVRSSFTLERDYTAPVQKAFQAFADPAIKAQWFGGPSDEWEDLGTGLDFREGG